jgi:hypothetical protein
MNTKSSANAFGYASLVCSLSFWILLTLRAMLKFSKIDFLTRNAEAPGSFSVIKVS